MLKRLLTFVVALFIAVAVNTSADKATDIGGPNEETFEFQAEVSRMMDIIINSLYQKKEVFLREVISNGADALDKIRFLSLQDPSALDTYKELEMRITFDEQAKTLTIRDSGVGMTRQELIENLGTVAKSGTTNFVEQLANTGDLSLIGQFGVGFYSVYLVANKVVVRTKTNNDADQYIWESTADSTFSVRKDEGGEPLGRGTEITLHLKEEALEYTNPYRLTALVEKYSEFVGFPIYIYKEEMKRPDEEEDEDYDDEEEEDEEDEDEDEEDEEDYDDEEEEEDKASGKEWQWVLINAQKAIWTRSASEIEDEEYHKFFRSISKTEANPLVWTHFKAEGEVEFRSILFVPELAPYNQYDQFQNIDPNLKLYVRKVLIKDDFQESLVPRYLNFLHGVVDSDDLPLAVSRETLQQAKAINVIGKKLVRKALDMLSKMAQKELKYEMLDDDEEEEEEAEMDEEMEEKEAREAEKFSKFYSQYGKNLKVGYIDDQANRERLSKLLRFKSTKVESGEVNSPGKLTSFEGYVKRMQPWQKSIFYLTGENMKHIMASPLLKKAQSKGMEVLLMDDPIDEYVLQHLKRFDEYSLVSLGKEGVKFGDETDLDKKREKEYKKKFKGLKKWLKNDLYNNPKEGGKEELLMSLEISATTIDENIPAVVVTASFGNSATMERLMKSQAMGDIAKQTIADSHKILQLNPRNPIVNELNSIYETDVEKAKDIAWLLLDTALIDSGFDIPERGKFADRMYRLMRTGLTLESLEPMEWIEVPEEEEQEIQLEGEEEDVIDLGDIQFESDSAERDEL